jgi:hypothetical protein
MTNGNVDRLLALYRELVIKRKISFERIANLVDNALKRLPNMETLFEQAKREQIDNKRDSTIWKIVYAL